MANEREYRPRNSGGGVLGRARWLAINTMLLVAIACEGGTSAQAPGSSKEGSQTPALTGNQTPALTVQADASTSVVPLQSAATTTIRGRVVDLDGKRRGGVVVVLEARDSASNALLTRVLAITDTAGEYEIVYRPRPTPAATQLQLAITRQRVRVEERRYLPDSHKWMQRDTLVLRASTGEPQSRQVDFRLTYDHAPPFFTLLLILPALVGLLSAAIFGAALVYQQRTAGEGTPADLARKALLRDIRPAPRIVAYYVFAGCIAWVVIIGFFAVHFVRSDLHTINLFDTSAQVPVLIPMAAFLGVLVFATTRLVELANERTLTSERELTLIEIGNRVFIAPYVAIIAVLVVFSDTSGPRPALLAFVTGLWIEPVLSAMRALGERLLLVSPQSPASGPTSVPIAAAAAAPPLADKPADLAPVPVLTSAVLEGGGGTALLRLTGSGFRDRTVVTLDGQKLTIAKRTAREMEATPGGLAPTEASRVVATTPPPGGGTSSVGVTVQVTANA
jgi:hypothetical protein